MTDVLLAAVLPIGGFFASIAVIIFIGFMIVARVHGKWDAERSWYENTHTGPLGVVYDHAHHHRASVLKQRRFAASTQVGNPNK